MKSYLLMLMALVTMNHAMSQRKNHWTSRSGAEPANRHKSIARASFPTSYKLFDVADATFQQELKTVVDSKGAAKKTILSLPNADGGFEEFEMVEASNFEPELQAKYPNIRAFSGRGITNPSSTAKVSISPEGLQGMILRSDRENEYIEPFSNDKKTYAAFRSQRKAGQAPWTCSTQDQQLANAINGQVLNANLTGRNGSNIKTLRLAQSCNAEYSNYFGATSSAQVNLVLAAFNNTLTRCNGVYEKDLALHLNLIANTTSVIYYNASTDPYTTMSSWNGQLQTTLTSVIGAANYDIGHLFGSSGGGGNAGCIGCVCVDASKGSGITSPADGIPQGDNFDIDYVVHEVGHQLGANHTFSHTLETGTGVNKEVGSGITIMGYAGITSYDVAPHSIDIFHQASIAQIQSNINGKACPVTTAVSNQAPVVSVAASTYTIPKSTPFALTAIATDETPNALTYCWEQNDNSTVSAASSIASITKASGPNWVSYSPSASPTRIFPTMRTILLGRDTTGPLAGGDAAVRIEALSSVARTLNFRVTVRDNAPYFNDVTNGYSIGQTNFADVAVTVSTAGPFAVTAPNTAVSWGAGTSQTVTWSVNSTNLAPVNCANVKISLSTDGGQTFPTVLAANTPNDGSEVLVMPNVLTSTARIKIEAVGNIFFDISNTNFTLSSPPLCGDPAGLTTSAITINSATIGWTGVTNATSYRVEYKTSAAATWTVLTTGQAGTTANLTGLTSGTAYVWRVQATCPAGTGNLVQASFTTTVQSCASIYDNATNGTAAGAAVIPFNTDIKGLINVGTDVDLYKFTITTGGTITMTLTTLPANYHLRLISSNGTTVVATSSNGGTTNETINTTVAAGIYYARVYPNNTSTSNATTCYTLRVALGTASKVNPVATVELNSQLPSQADGELNSGISVYPNPVQGMLNINLGKANGVSEITVLDMKGVQMTRTRSSQTNTQLNMGKLPSGVYMIRVVDASGKTSRMKVVKQ